MRKINAVVGTTLASTCWNEFLGAMY